MTEKKQVEVPLTLLQRLNTVMAEVSYVQKDRTIDVGQRGYKVVTHDAVTAKVRTPLVKHGVFYYPHSIEREQSGKNTIIDMVVRFVNVDDREDFIDVPTCGYGLDTGDTGPGKAMSYAVKYALLKALGLETGEDADNEASPETSAHEPQGEKVEKGPRGGKPKPERDSETIALEWFQPGPDPDDGPQARIYPFNSWNEIRAFLTDLDHALAVDPECWEPNMNDIERVRKKLQSTTQTKLDPLREILEELELKAEAINLQRIAPA